MRRLWRAIRPELSPLLVSVFVVVGLVAAAAPFSNSFFEGAPYEHVALSSGLAVLAAWLTQRRLPAAADLLLGLALGTVALTLLLADLPAFVGVPDSWWPMDLWRDVATGWANLLAAPVPIEQSPLLLALPLAVSWCAAYLTILLVAATRSVIIPALPLVIATVGFLLLGPGPLSLTAGVVVGACLLAMVAAQAARAGVIPVSRATDGDPAIGRSIWLYALRSFSLVGLPAIALAIAVAGGLALATSWRPARTDLHDAAQIEVRDELTPLSNIRPQLLEDQPQELFTIQVDGTALEAEDVEHLRIATLDRYDGALWTSGGVFLPLVRQVRRPDVTERDSSSVTGVIEFTQGYSSSYLPMLGLLRTVDGPALGLNEDSDTLVTEVEPGTLDRLEFTSVVPTGDRPTELSQSGPPGVDVGLGDLVLPPQFADLANGLGRSGDPVSWLEELESVMNDETLFGYSVDNAYSGHALPTLANYIGTDPVENFDVSRQGYAEQGAAAFTLLARDQNLPARVAVGYRLNPEQAARVAAGDTVLVTTDNAHAWSEVYLGDEWVAFEPTNTTDRPSTPLSSPGVSESTTSQVEEADEPQRPPPVELDDPEPGSFPWGPLAIAGLALLILLLPWMAKVVRRRLRRRGPPAERLARAWWEVRDRLRERGLRLTQSTSLGELGSAVDHTVFRPGHLDSSNGAEVDRFVELVDRGLYGAAEPSDDEAREAWLLVTPVVRTLTDDSPLLRRVVGPFDPRPLLRPPRGQPTALARPSDPADDEAATSDEDDAVIDLRDAEPLGDDTTLVWAGEPDPTLEEVRP